MKRKIYHVVPAKDGWGVHCGLKRAWKYRCKKKRAAIKEATRSARVRQLLYNEPWQVVVHGKNGRFQAEWTYGRDPAVATE